MRHTAFLSLLGHSHTKLPPATLVSPEQAYMLEEFRQRVHKSRPGTYHTLFHSSVSNLFFCPCCLHSLSVHTSFSYIQAMHVPAVAHIASHNKRTANSVSLPSSQHYLSCMSMVREDKQSPTENREGRNNSVLPKRCIDSQRLERRGSRTSLWSCVLRSGTGRCHKPIWAHGQSSRQIQGHLLPLVQCKRKAQPSLSIFLHMLGFQTWTVHTGPGFCQKEEKGNTFHRDFMDCINFQIKPI